MNDLINRQDVIALVHKTIFEFFEYGDEPMNEQEKMLLELNKAICNCIKDLPSNTGRHEQKTALTHLSESAP